MSFSSLRLDLEIFENDLSLAERAAEIFLKVNEKSVERKSAFNVALSGGNTPLPFFRLLAEKYYPQSFKPGAINFFWADERPVPEDHPDSNYGGCRKYLADSQNLLNFYPIRCSSAPEKAAAAYERLLLEKLPRRNNIPVFDLILLGMGGDGHTASLFPASPLLGEKKRFAAADYVEKLRSFRVTLTLPVINNAGLCVFMVKGADKRMALARALDLLAPPELPAQFVRPEYGKVIWLVDKKAAYG